VIDRPTSNGGNHRDGAAAAELAIVLPMLAVVFLFAVDFCRAYYYTQVIESAAYQGAIYASGTAQPTQCSSATDAAVQAAVREGASLQPPLTADNVNVTTNNGVATVTVTYQFNTLFAIVGINSTTTIVRTVNMNVAPAPPGGW
jgi:Flp pilus assembly protein TadG